MRRLSKVIQKVTETNDSDAVRALYSAQLAELERVGYTTEEAADALNYKPVTDSELQQKINVKVKAKRDAKRAATQQRQAEVSALLNWINNE